MRLSPPKVELEQPFLQFYFDYVAHDPVNGEYYSECLYDFTGYVTRLKQESLGINLRSGYVPCSHFWLVNRCDEVIGVIRIRHNIDSAFLAQEAGHIGYDICPSKRGQGYGQKMLSLALSEVAKLGIKKALVTANKQNQASRRVIEVNGGQFEGYVQSEIFDECIARYWIEVT
ncbi:GNAT family N-acetyltransferase [Vibrio ponticus]|uniref:GNAT family N-acetyltransferase n=1 Tax=Vibrio ponticus TaxID=265668 RepID=A0A3N3DUC9_9VIBR|nr:GNAT family N-acetyltransferase [Vibrio ponticus]ROV57798.1 GNAT family N-acetyltransferase [Vibrio ponticus]